MTRKVAKWLQIQIEIVSVPKKRKTDKEKINKTKE